MNLQLETKIAEQYHSNSQKIRVMTERWVHKTLFCPYCGNTNISRFGNNMPVADFFCSRCSEEYELKSMHNPLKNKVNDGAYDTMITRILSINNPNFFFMYYGKNDLRVKDFMMVPKHFLVPEIIERRKPLSDTAKRAGWVGCNILLNQIPMEGRIYIVKDEIEQPIADIVAKVKKYNFIRQYKLEARGWIMDILNCVNSIEERNFTLQQMYQFEEILAVKHPQNYHVKAKIRQQLQILRDNGIIEFCGRGHYKKI